MAGWTPEDVVRFETGNQSVRDVEYGGRTAPLCETHRQQMAGQAGLADQVGHQTGLADEHEGSGYHVRSAPYTGQCVECARRQQGMPWQQSRTPRAPRPLAEERMPSPPQERRRGRPAPGRWPYRSMTPNERHLPVDTSLPPSLNSRRVAVVHHTEPMDVRYVRPRQAIAHYVSADLPSGLRMTAHDSGDQSIVFHCFAGETRYLTSDGVKTLAETVGTSQWVLAPPTSEPHEQSAHMGHWILSEIKEFGQQRLWEIVLQRNGRTKTIRATEGHRWFVRRPMRTVLTRDLRPGQRLASLRATQRPFTLDHEGIRQGFVVGDGTIQHRGARTYGAVTLWGSKRDLGKYFDEVATRAYPVQTDNGVDGLRYTSGMHGFTKEIPEFGLGSSTSMNFLWGWLAGYFAADGTVSETGGCSISSSSLDTLLALRDLCTHLGIGTFEPCSRLRSGWGAEPTLVHTMSFVAADFSPDFFLREDQRARYRADRFARLGWTVRSVRETDAVETVYCAQVPGVQAFTLEDNILTGNCPQCGSGQVIARSDGTIMCEFCNLCFTVMLAPEFSAFPQTIDGQPVDIPGMGAGLAQNPALQQGAPGDEGADEGPPANFGSEQGPEEGDPEETDEPQDEKGNPIFNKSSGKMSSPGAKNDMTPRMHLPRAFRTATGAALDDQSYVQYLALENSRHTPLHKRVLAKVRDINKS